MANSRSGSPLVSPPLKLRGARGVMKGFAEGTVKCLARAEMPHRIPSPLTGEE